MHWENLGGGWTENVPHYPPDFAQVYGVAVADAGTIPIPPVPGEQVMIQVTKADGSTFVFATNHTFSDEQVEWFEAGSALNVIRSKTNS